MRNKKLILAAACAAIPAMLGGLARSAQAQTIVLDGNLDTAYGAPKAVQTNNTGFGDNSNTDGITANGNELDAAYAAVSNGYLNLMFTGNIATDFTHLNIFIADGRTGQNTLNLSTAGGGGGNALSTMNGSKFSPGFNATYALDINGGNTPTTWFANRFDLTQSPAPGAFIGQFNPTLGQPSEFVANGIHSGVLASFNNSNTAGVSGNTGTTTLGADPTAVTTGFEFAIPLSQLSIKAGTLEVLADINGGGDGFLSNQFLPGLPAGSANIGNGGKFDFSGTPNMFFTVNIPPGTNINGTWALTTGGSWGGSVSWTGGVPSLPGDSATFGPTIAGAATVTLDGSRTVGQVFFNSPNSYTLAQGSGGTLTIDDSNDGGGVNPLIGVSVGNHTVSAPVVLANGVTLQTLQTTSLKVTGQISGAGPVTVSGGGVTMLSGNNSYSGNTTVLSGTMELDSNTAASTGEIDIGDPTTDGLPAAVNIGVAGMNVTNVITTDTDLATGNNLRTIAGTYASGSATLSGTINVNGGVVFAAPSGATLNVNSLIQDGTDANTSARRAIRVAGAGTVILNTSPINSGDAFVDSGTLNLVAGVSLPAANVTVAQGATMDVNGSLSATANVNANGSVNFAGNNTGSGFTRMLGSLVLSSGATVTDLPSLTSKNPAILSPGTIGFADNTGKIDLTNNELITLSDVGTVRSEISGGNLVTSQPTAVLGFADIGNGQIEIRATRPGDANLDGKVNAADFALLAANYGSSGGAVWTQGDFDYNSTVDVNDFNLLAANFNGTLAAPALGTLVPEPTMIGGIILAGSMLARRRRS